MAAPSRIEGDVYVNGTLTGKTLAPSAGCVVDASVSASADIAATKVNHQHRAVFAQANSSAASETRVIYVCYGASGTVVAFSAGSIAAAVGAATVTVDLKKNGTSILTGVITLDNANTARVVEAGTLTGSNSVVAGDVLEVVTVATAGGGTLPTGVFAAATINEKPA